MLELITISRCLFNCIRMCIETSLSKMKLPKTISIPTIGIGASNNCDGQILVI